MSMFSRATSVVVKPDKKLRDLPLKETNYLINILNRHNCWQELAAVITHPDNSNALLFNSDSIGYVFIFWSLLLLHFSGKPRNCYR